MIPLIAMRRETVISEVYKWGVVKSREIDDQN